MHGQFPVSEDVVAGRRAREHPKAQRSDGASGHTVGASSTVSYVHPERVTILDALPAYDVVGELGRGGSGVVLEGRHKHLGREVAIKQAPRTLTDNPAVRKRFTAEARLLASLDHPHIVPIYDFVEHAGLCLLIMEKLPAGMLWDRFPDGVDVRRACALMMATCSGLQAAHAQG